MSWMLQIGNGAPSSFTSLGCVGLKRRQRSQMPGTFTFRLNVEAIEADPIAAVNDLATITASAGGQPIFAGRVTRVPLAGAASLEQQEYEISDAWSDFERITYQQQWNRIISEDEGGSPTIAAQYSACCLLGCDLNGNAMSSGQVISDAVNWAIARGANCQLGLILINGAAAVDSPIPVDEVTDLPVAEIIKRMIRFTPDAVAWFDYTATPPRFNVTRQAQCQAITIPFTGQGDSVKITPRNDLLRPQVLLRYEQPNVSDGTTYTEVYVDAAPEGADGLAFGALVATVRLAGSNATFQKQAITTAAIPTGADDANAVPFLKSNTAWLNKFSSDRLQVNVFTAEILSGQIDDEGDAIDDLDNSDYPNQLLTGTICKWMSAAYPDLKTANATIYSNISYLYPDIPDEESTLAMKYFGPTGGSLPGWCNAVEVDFNIKATNALQQTYSMLSDYTEPEAPPTGMAAALYSALSVLQYEGEWSATGAEAIAAATLGIALNLTGGRPEWATMNALVQEIIDDLDTGATTYRFGPAGHLTIQSLKEQLRVLRKRKLSGKIKERSNGQPSQDIANGPGHTHLSSGGSPPMPTAYPWIDFIDIEDDADGNPETWAALLGYGQSSFAGADAIDHSGPLESLEISVGHDGSEWEESGGSAPADYSNLYNALSLITGDDTPANDQLLLGRTDAGGNGGSLILSPFDPSLVLSPNLDGSFDPSTDQFINIDLSNGVIQVQNDSQDYVKIDTGTGGSPEIDIYADASGDSNIIDSNSITITAGSGGSDDATLTMTGHDGASVTIDTSDLDGGAASFQQVTFKDCSGNTKTAYILMTTPA